MEDLYQQRRDPSPTHPNNNDAFTAFFKVLLSFTHTFIYIMFII